MNKSPDPLTLDDPTAKVDVDDTPLTFNDGNVADPDEFINQDEAELLVFINNINNFLYLMSQLQIYH